MAAVNVNKLGRGAFCCVLACSLFSVVCATGSNETSSDETSSPVIPSRTFVNDVPCHAISVDLSSMVTRGHLVGAVIAALLGGIILGAVCISFAPRLIEYIREANVLPNSRKNDADRTEEREEMATLVRVEASPSSPDRAPAPAPTAVEVPTPKLDLALPGDNPPPGNSPQGRRKASNAYTPYLEMGGTAATAAGAGAKRDDVARSLNVTQQAPRNISPTRMTSPLPALPGDDVEKAVTPGTSPDDLYANSDAHVYEGMRLDAPIYENRETRVYESLKRAPTEQQ